MKFKLDFNIYSAQDRANSVRSIDLSSLSPTELETISNFILFGKDEDGTSVVDRKEVQIKTKFNSYQRDKCVSLDEMMEQPGFDETIFNHDNTIYKKKKPEIDKERAKLIPGMTDLWDEIGRLGSILKQNQGKEPMQPNTPKLDNRQQYLLNHHLIQLRTQQYYLWDSFYPQMGQVVNKAEFKENPCDKQLNVKFFPRGLMRRENDEQFIHPRKQGNLNVWEEATDDVVEEAKLAGERFVDFRDKHTLYQLIVFYEELAYQAESLPDSLIHNLLWTLDFYIEKANLDEQQRLIVEMKKKRATNYQCAQALEQQLGIVHQENYISTIWNRCLEKIQKAIELNFDEMLCRNYDRAWKKCCCCGEEKLRDNRNFVKRKCAADGLSTRCKVCDKKMRQEKMGREEEKGKTDKRTTKEVDFEEQRRKKEEARRKRRS